VLQIGDDFKQIALLRVATGPEHAHQTFRGAMGRVAQFGEADGGVDEVATRSFGFRRLVGGGRGL